MIHHMHSECGALLQCLTLTSRERQISDFKAAMLFACLASTLIYRSLHRDELLNFAKLRVLLLDSTVTVSTWLISVVFPSRFLSRCDDQSLEAHYCKILNHLKWSFTSLWQEEKCDQRTLEGLGPSSFSASVRWETRGCVGPLSDGLLSASVLSTEKLLSQIWKTKSEHLSLFLSSHLFVSSFSEQEKAAGRNGTFTECQ